MVEHMELNVSSGQLKSDSTSQNIFILYMWVDMMHH